MGPQVVDGLWCIPADSLARGSIERQQGELVFLPDAVEFHGSEGTLHMAPIRGFGSTSIQAPKPEVVIQVDHGVDGTRAYIGFAKFSLDKVRSIFAIFNEYAPASTFSLIPFKERFIRPALFASKQIDSLANASIRMQNSCVGCGMPTAPRMTVPWHLEVSGMSEGPFEKSESGWLSPRVPMCLTCHRFGLFDLFEVSAEYWPNIGMRLFVKFPTIAAYEPFRIANELSTDSFLARPIGGAHLGKTMPEEKAEAALKPGVDAWTEMEERFGLHRYLRLKARLRQLSAKKGVIRRRFVLPPEEIRTGLNDLMAQEGVSEDDLWEMATLMKEDVPALLELG